MQSRIQLAVVEPSTDPDGKHGLLALSRQEDRYFISFIESDHIYDHTKPKTVFAISQINDIELTKNDIRIDGIPFTYSDFLAVSEFVESLLVQGICIPTPNPYHLAVYKRCFKGMYPYLPPHIQMEQTESLPKLWDAIYELFQRLMIQFAQSETLPRDPAFPLILAARGTRSRLQIPMINLPPITKGEWNSLFDEEGRIFDFPDFQQRIFHGGIDNDLLPDALPFIFKMYPPTSSQAERDTLDAELSHDYDLLVDQLNNLKPEQIANNAKWQKSFKLIDQDVERTDRNLPAFKQQFGPGCNLLRKLLRLYCLFNPPVSYLQGMNDLFVPIFHVYIQDWSVDEDVHTEQFEKRIFWLYEAMIRNVAHFKLLSTLFEETKAISRNILKLVNSALPLAGIWLKRMNLDNMQWIYAEYVLLFKRTCFTHIWDFWTKMNCAEFSEQSLTYFSAAAVIDCFEKIATMDDPSEATLMGAFLRFLAECDAYNVAEIAQWLFKNHPLKCTAEPVSAIEKSIFLPTVK